jgi:amino acid permease
MPEETYEEKIKALAELKKDSQKYIDSWAELITNKVKIRIENAKMKYATRFSYLGVIIGAILIAVFNFKEGLLAVLNISTEIYPTFVIIILILTIPVLLIVSVVFEYLFNKEIKIPMEKFDEIINNVEARADATTVLLQLLTEKLTGTNQKELKRMIEDYKKENEKEIKQNKMEH